MKWLIASAATVALAVTLARRRALASEPEVEQGASLFDEALTMVDPSTYSAPAVSGEVANGNIRAFLDGVLRFAEGTDGPDGYRTLFGGGLFDDYSDHPRQAFQFTDRAGRTLWTTAAGAFQFLAISPLPGGGSTRVDTWDRMQRKLGLPDFSPASQDAAAIQLIRERGALGDVMAGRIVDAVRKCAPIWASLPGAGYAQPERQLQTLLASFQSAGGIYEA